MTYDRLKSLGDAKHEEVDTLLDRLMSFATQEGEIRLLKNWISGKDIAGLKGLRSPSPSEALNILKLWYTSNKDFDKEIFDQLLDKYDDQTEDFKRFREALTLVEITWKIKDDDLIKFWGFIHENFHLHKRRILVTYMELINNIFYEKARSIEYCKAFFENIGIVYNETYTMVANDIFEGLFPIYYENYDIVVKQLDELIQKTKKTEHLGFHLVERQYEILSKIEARKLKELL